MKTLFIVLIIIYVLLTLLNKSKEKRKLFQVYSIKNFSQLNHHDSVDRESLIHKVNEFFKGNQYQMDDQLNDKIGDDSDE
ncbi:hypothetical protein FS935_02345 [Metabacillus litoralis]|uniref:Uncharacterized protein n=1 Tax=Metabacillus litoralis TaxID=152268 RepID=A0A5C6W7Y0_9BACI|nr:hypothetical protein [Metabacillus litoralis]TXC93055.1 hypothetical protein FS935_02345 [Metabacillus litoralis]